MLARHLAMVTRGLVTRGLVTRGLVTRGLPLRLKRPVHGVPPLPAGHMKPDHRPLKTRRGQPICE
jgi:hypothetical protein